MPGEPRRSVFALCSWWSFLLQGCAGLGIAAGDLLRSRVYCLAKWRNDYNSSTQHTLSVDTTPLPTADALYDEVNACCSQHERTANECRLQSHGHEHMQFVWKIVEFPEILIVRGIQTSDYLRTAPVRHMEYAETLEVLEVPVVQHIQPALPWSIRCPAPAMTCTAPPRVVEYTFQAPPVHAAPAPVVKCVAPAPVTEFMTPSLHAPVVQVVQVSPVQTIGIIIETRVLLFCSRHPNFRESGNCSCSPNEACGEHGRGGVQAVPLWRSCSSHATRDVPPVVVEHAQPDPVTEYATPALHRGGDSIGVS